MNQVIQVTRTSWMEILDVREGNCANGEMIAHNVAPQIHFLYKHALQNCTESAVIPLLIMHYLNV